MSEDAQQITWISTEDLAPHPQNPRIIIRDDVIDGIAANLADGFDPAHALIVRPVQDGYQIISGHHRKLAAEKAELSSVPCWVREMDDETAYMALVTCNGQGELSPLEIGMHALHCVGLSAGGRGQKGGLSEYADKVGRKQNTISELVNAARVTENLSLERYVLQDKTKHLAAIHALPEASWQDATQAMLDGGWTAKETSERVKQAKEDGTNNVFTEAHNHRAQGTGENEWYTPTEYIEAARRVLRTIDLDPASSDLAQSQIKANAFYTKDDDGLALPWNGRIWLNPPYSQPAIQQFIDKLVEEIQSGRTTEAIILTHNYTDTHWFHLAASIADSVCFTKGRIGFVNAAGEKAAPTQGQAFFYFGNNAVKFGDEFCRFGFVVDVLTGQQLREAA